MGERSTEDNPPSQDVTFFHRRFWHRDY